MTQTSLAARRQTITFRKPVAEDGAEIWALIKSCPPLDVNSMYCNMVQCDHFRETCVLAEMNGEPVGWISGYLVPNDPETLFVWQVAVSEKARGCGLGKRMLAELLERTACRRVRRMQTTITRDNAASWGLFRSFADARDAELDHAPHFTRDDHFNGAHATEHMVTIALPARLRKAA
ncbi:diaminobutyrate acetyltransferase [Halovulum dunhuangense]|uniref:L-2,4-diaminobutyric acid acetyltransferase n=1 Tax=Halovulum dunhuangense TaxID=1505036 RepID=A0A849L239_9RHOB|nr:diaminobutyrate acetyltransferase [Halovulum dunhuangense]NNU80329.1 diaminobutyrate acetyltransferase [Halovulum dunhuangense]